MDLSTSSLTTSLSAAGQSAIEFKDVRLAFDEGEILGGVTFSAQERETVILLGETGTGKTLLLKLASGLLRPDSGSIQVLGKDISGMAESDLLEIRRQIGFVFQEGALYDSLTAGLDPITSQTIISLILRLRDVYGVTALLATHRLQDGFALANFHFDPLSKKVRRDSTPESAHVAPTRFLVLRAGKIYFEGTPDELMKSHDPYLQRFLI